MRGLVGSSAAEALLPNHLDVEHSSANCGSKYAVVKATAAKSPATTVPMPTITRSFLLFGSFMAVALSTSVLFRMHRNRKARALFALPQGRDGWLVCGRARATKQRKESAAARLSGLLPKMNFVEFRFGAVAQPLRRRVNAGAAALSA